MLIYFVYSKDQINKQIEEWKKGDNWFVPTRAEKVVLSRINDQNCVVVTGNSGTGKTFTVRHIALKLRKEGYTIVPAEDPEDIKRYFKHAKLYFFLMIYVVGLHLIRIIYTNGNQN